MSWLSAGAGAIVVLAVLREVFHTLFHPAGWGGLSKLVFGTVWRGAARLGPRARGLAGPSALLLVIGLWTALLVLGWTLIYWPWMPERFIVASALDRAEQAGFVDALYFAWVTQSTLGFGDITPTSDVLRVLAPLQATIGFGMFTVAVTWVLSTYPALQRQRAAASAAHAVRASHEQAGVARGELPQPALARQLERLAGGLSSTEVDYVQFPGTFYFAAPDRSMSLAAALPFMVDLARDGELSGEARLAAGELRATLDGFAATVGERHLALEGASTDDVLAAYRRHHGIAGG